MKYIKGKWLLITLILVFIIIPLFWFSPGEMDLGGDSNRLYFYDPLRYLSTSVLYNITPIGTRTVESDHSLLPFILMIFLVKSISSSYFVITLINIVKVAGGFLSSYLLIRELLKNLSRNSKE